MRHADSKITYLDRLSNHQCLVALGCEEAGGGALAGMEDVEHRH
jgi:hypothetical protein